MRTEQATVYVGARRRYFTRKAAARSLARAEYLKANPCECEPEDHAAGYGGYDCGCWGDEAMAAMREIEERLMAEPDAPEQGEEEGP